MHVVSTAVCGWSAECICARARFVFANALCKRLLGTGYRHPTVRMRDLLQVSSPLTDP